MKRRFTLHVGVVSVVALLLSGCSGGPKPLYNYGKYSESYYGLKKDATVESALEYQKALEYCIEGANESRSGRVPPGMYANLGYLYLKAGNSSKAVESFEKEKSIYPEAVYFMERMINRVKSMEAKNDK